MKDQSKQPEAVKGGVVDPLAKPNVAQPSIGGPGQGGMPATPGGQGQSFNASGGSLALNNSVAPANDAMTIPADAAPAAAASSPTAPPGYHYSADGMLLLGDGPGAPGSSTNGGGGASTAPPGTVNPNAPGGTNGAPTTAGAPTAGNNGMPDFGALAGAPAAGPIQTSVAPGGPIQTALPNAGQIQQKLDLSGLGNYASSAGYGKIQDKLDVSNVPALASGDALGQQMTQAQQAAYKNATGYLDPQWQQQQQQLETQLANQGVPQNSEAWNKAMESFGRQKQFAYDQAYSAAYSRGLDAQGQLFGQGLAVNQNQFGQNLAAGQFANSAQAQGFGQSLANANLQNQARSAQGNEAIAAMTLGNAAQGQQFGQNLAAGQFGNAAQGQQFGQNLAGATFGNAAQGQQFGQNLQAAGLQNQTQAQLADQWLRRYGIDTGLKQTERAAQASENAAASSAGASTQNTQAQLAAQAAQNDFLNNLALRNQGLNEAQLQQQNAWALLGLMNGQGNGPTQPNFTNTPQTNVNGTDVAGLYNNQYNGQLNSYNAQVGQQNSNTAAMATILAAMLSDRRLKKNIRQIGVHARVPVAVYEYVYLWGERAIGVMADELEKVMPEAVLTLPNGFKAVDYARL